MHVANLKVWTQSAMLQIAHSTVEPVVEGGLDNAQYSVP